MRSYLFLLLFTIFSIHCNAQSSEDNDATIDGDKLSKSELYSLESNGWVNMKYRGKKYLLNLSNKDYILHFSINCKDESKRPSFLIEFSNNYRDGNFGGIDFASSESNSSRKIVFFIDGNEFGNPFEDVDRGIFKDFIDSLKDGEILIIKYFESNYNSETKNDQFELNRELKFMLENGQLLEESVDCME